MLVTLNNLQSLGQYRRVDALYKVHHLQSNAQSRTKKKKKKPNKYRKTAYE